MVGAHNQVAMVPYAWVLDIVTVAVPLIRLVPEANRLRRERRLAHQIAFHHVRHGLALGIKYVHIHAQAEALRFAGIHRQSFIVG